MRGKCNANAVLFVKNNDYRIANTMSSLPPFRLLSWGCSISVYVDMAILTGVVWVATESAVSSTAKAASFARKRPTQQ
jgi:hypothetical protein